MPELEMMFEIWNDGWRNEIGPDRDGLGLIEIRYFEGGETTSRHRMSFSKEEAKLVAKALTKLTEE